YRGDLCPDDPYGEILDGFRRALRERFVDVVVELASVSCPHRLCAPVRRDRDWCPWTGIGAHPDFLQDARRDPPAPIGARGVRYHGSPCRSPGRLKAGAPTISGVR